MLIVIAEKEELKLVDELGYSKYPIIITGVGVINVINALNNLPKDIEILNIGYCGSNVFKVGTRLQICAVGTNHEIANFYEELQPLQIDEFIEYDDKAFCYTSTDFVTKTNKIEPCVFDMELAIIRSIMPNTKSIKVVSDKLSLADYKNKIKGE